MDVASLQFWTILLAAIERCVAVGASIHAVLTKRETQSVIGWVGLVWLSPFIGPMLYFCFGINRIERKGQRIQRDMDRRLPESVDQHIMTESQLRPDHPFHGRLAVVVERLTGKPLLGGNEITPLPGGEFAYPQMLEAIDQAEHSVALCSYIFDNDRAGKLFVEALDRAQQRGVQVRVLIDDVGVRYSHPSILAELRQRAIHADTFLPTMVPRLAQYSNLRNHRKLLVVDGLLGFAGGMNIRAGCRLDWMEPHPIQDIHFRITGPVVSHIQESFVTDWAFATGEKLGGRVWFPVPEIVGQSWARGIPDGPDTDMDNIRLTILAALSSAEKRIEIVTPYFLPDDSIISGLSVASMRGVRVRIVTPHQNNIKMVKWASMDPLSRVLEHGCEVFQTPPPFDHSKLLIVDDVWTLIGSSNWDPRSLRLNFEFNIEVYDFGLNTELTAIVEQKIEASRRLTLTDLKSRRLPARMRDGLARLAIPYL